MYKNDQLHNEQYRTDIIVIMDESGSMISMGGEPVEAVNNIIKVQQQNNINNGDKFTYITFNNKLTYIVDHQPLSSIQPIDKKTYKPNGTTSLNDAVCLTVQQELNSEYPNNKIMLIVTDGLENSSQVYTSNDAKQIIVKAEQQYNWKFIFIGANIDVFAEGKKFNIEKSQCGQFDQKLPGDLIKLCRQASESMAEYRQARSTGLNPSEIVIKLNNTQHFNETEENNYPSSLLPFERKLVIHQSNRSHLQSPRHPVLDRKRLKTTHS